MEDLSTVKALTSFESLQRLEVCEVPFLSPVSPPQKCCCGSMNASPWPGWSGKKQVGCKPSVLLPHGLLRLLSKRWELCSNSHPPMVTSDGTLTVPVRFPEIWNMGKSRHTAKRPKCLGEPFTKALSSCVVSTNTAWAPAKMPSTVIGVGHHDEQGGKAPCLTGLTFIPE